MYRIAILAALSILSACGGGGSDAPEVESFPVPAGLYERNAEGDCLFETVGHMSYAAVTDPGYCHCFQAKGPNWKGRW